MGVVCLSRDKNPFTADNITATKSELSALSRYALAIFKQDPPDLHNAEQVEQTVIDYFNTCDKNGIKPSNLGLYAALGMSRQDIDNVLTGKSKSKASPAVIDIIKKCKLSLSAYREALAMSGKINPVTALFWAKNFDHMSDSQTISVVSDRTDNLQLSQTEIQKRIPVYSDVDIDAD